MRKRIGINLIWVKHKKCGGIESYIRNLLDGIAKYNKDFSKEYILITSKDNNDSFEEYLNKGFKIVQADVLSYKVEKRMIWEAVFLNLFLKKNKIDLVFNPAYSSPINKIKGIKYITVFHDLQILHYPNYFSFAKNMWFKFALKKYVKVADKIVTISNFVKEDVKERLSTRDDKINVIYNPVYVSENFNETDFDRIGNTYQIKKDEYFFTVSSLLPHKNLETLIKVMKEIVEKKLILPYKLVISGVNGKSKETIMDMIKKYNLEDKVILTGFISNYERDLLYKNCSMFLFSSIFEGFGMPPIEAALIGARVLTTKKTSLFEVTNGKVNYINNPFDVEEWIVEIQKVIKLEKTKIEFSEYKLEYSTNKYLELFERELE